MFEWICLIFDNVRLILFIWFFLVEKFEQTLDLLPDVGNVRID